MADDNCFTQKRKSKKSTKQTPQTTKWDPRGRPRAAARRFKGAGPSPAHLRQKVQPGPRNESAGQRKAGCEPGDSPPPSPRQDRVAPRSTCAPRRRPRSGSQSEPVRGGGRRALRTLCPPRGPLAPSPARDAPARAAPLPTWSLPPAASPLAAASCSAAIAGATRPALQPRGWRHRELRARPAPAWERERGRRGSWAARLDGHPRGPWARSRRRLAARPPGTAEPAAWDWPAAGLPAGERHPARGGVTAAPPPTPAAGGNAGNGGRGSTSRLSRKRLLKQVSTSL